MFTGLIEEIGRIQNTRHVKGSILFEIACQEITGDLKVDDSVAVQGVCLTVTDCSHNHFTATAVNVTVQRTTLSLFKINSVVNLERAMSANGRFGGHLVQGHVDGKGSVLSITDQGMGKMLTVQLPKDLMPYTIPKGSIAINGVSLTIANRMQRSIDLAIIPHTWDHTTLNQLRTGDFVNIEVDMMAKYVENFIKLQYTTNTKLDEARLKELGY